MLRLRDELALRERDATVLAEPSEAVVLTLAPAAGEDGHARLGRLGDLHHVRDRDRDLGSGLLRRGSSGGGHDARGG